MCAALPQHHGRCDLYAQAAVSAAHIAGKEDPPFQGISLGPPVHNKIKDHPFGWPFILVNSLNFNRMHPQTLRGCIYNLRESSDFYRCSLLTAQARIYTVIDHKEFQKSILLRNADTPDDRMRSRILPKSSFCSMLSFYHSFLHIG